MVYRLFVPVIIAISLSACASPARVERMVPTPGAAVAADSPLRDAVCVTSVKGGEATNPLWTSEVDNSAFRGAIEKALANYRLAAPRPADCALDVEANLLGLAQPIAGFSMEVTANVNYSVFRHATRNPYFQSTVVTPYTAEFSAAFLGVERLRIANEGAIRANIAKFLDELMIHARTNPPAAEGGAQPSS